MKKTLIAALLMAAPMFSYAQDVSISHVMSDSELASVTGQSFTLNITPAQIITGLQQTSTLLNKISPILPAQGQSVVTIVTSAANIAPVVNNLVNGGKPTTQDVVTLASNGIAAGVAIAKLSSGL